MGERLTRHRISFAPWCAMISILYRTITRQRPVATPSTTNAEESSSCVRAILFPGLMLVLFENDICGNSRKTGPQTGGLFTRPAKGSELLVEPYEYASEFRCVRENHPYRAMLLLFFSGDNRLWLCCTSNMPMVYLLAEKHGYAGGNDPLSSL